MRRLEALDKALIAIMLPLWVVCFGLHTGEVVRTGFAQAPLFASPPGPGEAYPTIGGFRMERARPETGLQVGDRLIRVGDEDLTGRGYFGFDALTLEEAGTGLVVPLVFERDGERRTIQLVIPSQSIPWYRIPILLSLVGIALVVLLRSRDGRQARNFFATMLSLAFVLTPFFGGWRGQTYASWAVFFLGGPVAFWMLVRWAIRFPPEIAERDRLPTAIAWVGVLFLVFRLSYVFGGPVPSTVVPITTITLDAFYVALIIGIFSWNYSRAEALGRRRLRWMVYGAYVALVPLILTLLIPLIDPAFPYFERVFVASALFTMALPVAVMVAVVAYNLLDIDRLISATATYSVLVAAVLGVLLAVAPTVSGAVARAVDLDPGAVQLGLAVFVAALVIPVNGRVRSRVERVLFSERHALAEGIDALLHELGTAADPESLARSAGQRIAQLLRPETCVVYAKTNGEYEPVFVEGQPTPPAFPARSPLVAVMDGRAGPIASPQRGGAEEQVADPFARAALEILDAAVLVPVRRGDALPAFLALGCKRSGDVYTATDLALLAAVAERIASELERMDAAVRGEAERDALRRYVPGAVADHVASGDPPEASERDVSVLFVDIRGYSSLSEGRRPEEVFSLINRYTESVSEVVVRHDGSVVEFNGDGMMALFGAPQALEAKERAAVEVALAIVHRLREESRSDPSPIGAFEVGVGIATGPAFVGTIRSADRWIWTALGHTTNLASRLESLTRSLDASIVIDTATRLGAGPAAAGFERHEAVPIRGLSRPATVHALPLGYRARAAPARPLVPAGG